MQKQAKKAKKNDLRTETGHIHAKSSWEQSGEGAPAGVTKKMGGYKSKNRK